MFLLIQLNQLYYQHIENNQVIKPGLAQEFFYKSTYPDVKLQDSSVKGSLIKMAYLNEMNKNTSRMHRNKRMRRFKRYDKNRKSKKNRK